MTHAPISSDSPEEFPPHLRVVASGTDSSLEQTGSPHEGLETPSLEVASFLSQLRAREIDRFRQVRQEMTFSEYLEALLDDPNLYVRNSARYQADAFEHYGSREREVLGRSIRDFHVRYFPWQSPAIEQPRELIGQEIATYEYYQKLLQFAKQERPNSLIVAHGPPGSGKTYFLAMRDEMLEDYSRNVPSGALYRLVWTFDSSSGRKLGFRVDETSPYRTEKGGFRIPADNNTPPFFLLSLERPDGLGGSSPRELLLEELKRQGKIDGRFNINYFLSRGLDPLSEGILAILLREYEGDFEQILAKHVRVERWEMSLQLGRGVVRVPPNPDLMSEMKDLNGGSPYEAPRLPSVLMAGTPLISTSGFYPSANLGVLHFTDMLRMNLSRYDGLLDTVQDGVVQIASHREHGSACTLKVNTTTTADSNDEHIRQNEKSPLWPAWKTRMSFVSFPYVVRFLSEAHMYEVELRPHRSPESVFAPHVLNTLALFCVSSRLLRPDAAYPAYKDIEGLSGTVKTISVVEKALLLEEDNPEYDANLLRSRTDELSASQIRTLKRGKHLVADEYRQTVDDPRFPFYDGGFGISSRDSVKILKDIATENHGRHITVLEVLNHLQRRLKSGFKHFHDLEALKESIRGNVTAMMQAESGVKTPSPEAVQSRLDSLIPYGNPKEILAAVELYARRKVETDIALALGLGAPDAMRLRMVRYVEHVRAFLSPGTFEVREELRTQKLKDDPKADPDFLEEFENQTLGRKFSTVKEREEFRKGLMRDIGAWAAENGEKTKTDGSPISFEEHIGDVLPSLYEELRIAQINARRSVLLTFFEATNLYESEPEALGRDLLGQDRNAKKRAERWNLTVDKLIEMGYPRDSIAKHVVWAIGPLRTAN